MPAEPGDAPQRLQLALKLVVLALMAAVIALPINHLFYYLLLLISVIVLAVSRVTSQRRFWTAAIIIVAVAITTRIAVEVPLIEEGHNVFLPGGSGNALVTGLPPDVYRAMTAEFDRAYPPGTRCQPKTPGCWQDSEPPKRVYAFSFDGVYDKPAYSRRVTGIDFSDVEWQRLGFVNELAYNWYTKSDDVGRGRGRRGWQRLLHPWHITMPHFVMFRFPAAYAGSQLCWQGTLLWEGPGERFAPLPHTDFSCRPLAAGDVGKRIFGLAISPNSPLAMTLRPTATIGLLQLYRPALALLVVGSLLVLLLRWTPRRLVYPLTLVALSLVVIAASDSTLLGGLRPFDSGDDGLVYDGWSRIMAQQLLAGDVVAALKGIEPVFNFTPGSRYLRTVEHLLFGETYLGYVSLLLLLPFLVFCLFRRYFATRAALALALIFIAIPVGALFGSTLYVYVKHAAHGYGDPAAAVFFLAGMIALIGRSRQGPHPRFAPAFAAALLFAAAVCVRPNLAIGAAILLGGAGVAALWQRQGWRLAGMCIGFLPVFSMALHNWYYGGVFVLFSSHTGIAAAMPMPPQAYAAALWDLLRLDAGGGDVARGALQIRRLLLGPSESIAMIPVHAAALAIVVRVLLSRRYDGWLRLIAAATLGLYTPALFFIYSDRYQILAWLLTLLICCVWMRDEGLPWLDRRFPGLLDGAARQPAVAWLARRLDGFARAAGMVPAARRPAAISAA
ncbi:MAG: hypothetical protein QOF09_3654 [Alphaproteobacteria bacterium]|nr:hypothetical protein [Alphaproteobacteria bacterium]